MLWLRQAYIVANIHIFLISTMQKEQLFRHISKYFPHDMTGEQHRSLGVFCDFLLDTGSRSIFILRGSAGTGKTSLAAAMVKSLHSLGQKMVLLAPTGRAAKVFSHHSGHAAYTIHRRIYRQKSVVGDFNLNNNLLHDALFFVDESSMIAAQPPSSGSLFSGALLDSLVQFVYQGEGCRLVLIGDTAQLPPIGEEQSFALNADYMRHYGLNVYEAELNEVLRQSEESGILHNATCIRLSQDMPLIRFKGFSDVRMIRGDELIEALTSSYYDVGCDETMVVTRSNKRANIYNQGIRNTVLDREDILSSGDMLMIVKNKYLSKEMQRNFSVSGKGDDLEFIANGDRARVERVRNVRQLYGFNFADVTLSFPDYDNSELVLTVLTDTLTSESPSLTAEQQQALYERILEDYQDIPLKTERMKKLREDAYYNAVQVKYAYAVTCHKAQGGQWSHVYIDQGYMSPEMFDADYVHWLYTAVTRATERLFFVNWPDSQTEQP